VTKQVGIGGIFIINGASSSLIELLVLLKQLRDYYEERIAFI